MLLGHDDWTDPLTRLHLDSLRKEYGGTSPVVAAEAVDLVIESGTFYTLLWPSGCGKRPSCVLSPALKLQRAGGSPSVGRISIGSCPMRPVNTVFQHYALFPHIRVRKNVTFGLLRNGQACAGDCAPRWDAGGTMLEGRHRP